MKKNNKGFTLAELLIVVAIIAVLVAIAIPVFTTQLEKSREATDMSNLRAAYAEVMATYLANGAKVGSTDSTKCEATVTSRQTKGGWQNTENGKLYVRVDGKESVVSVTAKVAKSGSAGQWTVKINPSNTKLIEVS